MTVKQVLFTAHTPVTAKQLAALPVVAAIELGLLDKNSYSKLGLNNVLGSKGPGKDLPVS